MIEHMATVLHHSRARGTDKLVLLGIANHDGDGGSFPSLATLAKYANVDERTVRRSLRVLEELGEITVHLHGGGTRHTRADRRTNRYEILVRCPQGCDGGPQHRVPAPPEVQDDPRPVHGDSDGRTPTSPRDDDGRTPTSGREAPRGDAHVTHGGTPTSPEPSMNQPRPNPCVEPSASTPRRPDDVWDAVLAACHLTDQVPTTSAAGAWRKAVSELRRVGATPVDVVAKARAFRQTWPAATLTPTALARRWAEITPAAHTGAELELDHVAQAAGLGRNLARTDLTDEELEHHVPTDPSQASAFRTAVALERQKAGAR